MSKYLLWIPLRLTMIVKYTLLINIVIGMELSSVDEDAVLRTPDLIRKYGYPLEIHNVTTTDGYILTHHRIPHGKNNLTLKGKPVVLLQHGLLGSSSDWILKMPPDAIGYMLADYGYDVWLMNTRGNEYSESHIYLHPLINRRQFWEFSWHEIGVYDLPDTIDYVLNVTGQTKLFHIGHSQGTTAMYVLLSEKPKYNQKIKAHISYSPIAFHKHTVSLLFRLLAPIEAIGGLSALKLILGEFNFAPSNGFLRILTSITCHDRKETQILCSNVYFWIMGNNPEQMNTTMLPIIYGHFPAGSSMMQMAHYIQEMNSGKFRKFDYGPAGNLKKYNQRIPPDYKCDNIDIPIITFYGGRDSFAQLDDVEKLHSMIPTLKKKIFIQNWAHMDFLFGIDAAKEVYTKTVDMLNDINSV